MIDINEPVEQGHDMILNYDDGSQKLGTDNGFNREADKGKLISLPPNDNPDGDTNQLARQAKPSPSPQPRDKNGHFAKK